MPKFIELRVKVFEKNGECNIMPPELFNTDFIGSVFYSKKCDSTIIVFCRSTLTRGRYSLSVFETYEEVKALINGGVTQ